MDEGPGIPGGNMMRWPENSSWARALIEARARAGLTQEQLAARMGTSQSAVARMESGKVLPSGRTLARLARSFAERLGAYLRSCGQPSFRHLGRGSSQMENATAAARSVSASRITEASANSPKRTMTRLTSACTRLCATRVAT